MLSTKLSSKDALRGWGDNLLRKSPCDEDKSNSQHEIKFDVKKKSSCTPMPYFSRNLSSIEASK